MWNLTLYSAPGCCLCDEAKEAIAEFAKECPLTLSVVDINQDARLVEEYGHHIPVLALDGKEITRHSVSLKKLRVLRERLRGTADERG